MGTQAILQYSSPPLPHPVRNRRRSWPWGHLVLMGLLLLFFAVFLIWPIGQVVATGFISKDGGFTLSYVRLIFRDPMLVRGLINAAMIAGAVTGVSLLIALPLASLSVRYEFPGRTLLTGLLLVPLVLPPFVGALGMRLVLSRFGPLTQLVGGGGPMGIDWLGHYRILGIILIEALHLYPIMLLNIQAAMANVDPAMEQAAANKLGQQVSAERLKHSADSSNRHRHQQRAAMVGIRPLAQNSPRVYR
ncbi:MAG TPA: hypothetical protein VHP11_03835, partial [Tepidisphaeraceae bacterium]|nr:hypothetical protein [Tepidisphaeraceae bacterium]